VPSPPSADSPAPRAPSSGGERNDRSTTDWTAQNRRLDGGSFLMTAFIDSHAHLADPAFDVDRGQVIDRARAAGARAIVCIGESLDAAGRARSLSISHARFLFFTAGIHPHDAFSFVAERDLPILQTMLRAGACAVGECGLDYHYDNSPRPAQREAFAAQLDLAKRFGLPAVVHTRDAEPDTGSFVSNAGRDGVVGVLHCFTGSHELARTALDAGWYVSFSGIITFKKWTDDALLRLIPADRLLVESDAPYLAPVPQRGKRNEPAFVAFTLARLALVRETSSIVLAEQLIANSVRFFALDLPTPSSHSSKEDAS
jgi:TatD DNase family protein